MLMMLAEATMIKSRPHPRSLGDTSEELHQKAVKMFEAAAAQGHAGAQCNLGTCYAAGKGRYAPEPFMIPLMPECSPQ